MPDEHISEQTRRAILKSAAATLGVGAVGTAAGHPNNPFDETQSKKGTGAEDSFYEELDPDEEQFRNAADVGYHSMGDSGPASRNGTERRVYDGNMSQIDTYGDIAVLSFREATEDDPGRRMAVLDISEFNAAESQAELDDAELFVRGILRNQNAENNGATDIKLSDDGNYAFMGTQGLNPGGAEGDYEARDARSGYETTGGVVAVDISRRDDPQTVGSLTEPFSTGIHNLYHHRIDGTDYVFAIKDVGFQAPDSGLYVLEFDRSTGALTLVNRWVRDGNLAQGEVGPEHGIAYIHDVHVIDDPRTGRPTVYVAYWDEGVWVLDGTDPTDLEALGHFDMFQSHETTPVPGLVEDANGNERRVAVASHEEPDHEFDQLDDVIFQTPHEDKTNPNSTGTVFLIDCDGIYPEDAEEDHLDEDDIRDDSEVLQLGELDNWTWRNANRIEDEVLRGDDDIGDHDGLETTTDDIDRVRFPGTFTYALSPHNQTIQRHKLDTDALPEDVRTGGPIDVKADWVSGETRIQGQFLRFQDTGEAGDFAEYFVHEFDRTATRFDDRVGERVVDLSLNEDGVGNFSTDGLFGEYVIAAENTLTGQRETLITDERGIVVDSTRAPRQANGHPVVEISEQNNDEVDDEIERWVLHQSHYNQGTRYLVIEPGSERGLTGEAGPNPRRAARPQPNPEIDDREGDDRFGWINHSTDWNLRDIGHARPTNDELVGEEQTPDFWCSIEHFGATFSGDRNQGVRVTHHDAIPVERGRPQVEIERTVDLPVTTGNQATRVLLDIDVFGEDAVKIRDRIPEGYEIDATSDNVSVERTMPNGENGTFVEFDIEIGDSAEIGYFVESDDELSTNTLGPLSVRAADDPGDSIERWEAVEDELESLDNVGVEI